MSYNQDMKEQYSILINQDIYENLHFFLTEIYFQFLYFYFYEPLKNDLPRVTNLAMLCPVW